MKQVPVKSDAKLERGMRAACVVDAAASETYLPACRIEFY